MTIWTSKPAALLGLVGLLGACDSVPGSPGALLASVAPPKNAALPAVPLTQALMMRGQVTLVPPGGYCIDPESLSQNFALMGRCDLLGAPAGASGAPAGVLSVSIARNTNDAPLPSAAQVAEAANVAVPQNVRATDNRVIFKANGPPPSPDLAPQHWRGVAKLDRFIIGAALFGPEGQRAVSSEGATVLEDMLERTAAKTNAG